MKKELIRDVGLSIGMAIIIIAFGMYVVNSASISYKTCMNYTAGMNKSEMIEYKPTGEMINCTQWLIMNQSAANGELEDGGVGGTSQKFMPIIIVIAVCCIILAYVIREYGSFGTAGGRK